MVFASSGPPEGPPGALLSGLGGLLSTLEAILGRHEAIWGPFRPIICRFGGMFGHVGRLDGPPGPLWRPLESPREVQWPPKDPQK